MNSHRIEEQKQAWYFFRSIFMRCALYRRTYERSRYSYCLPIFNKHIPPSVGAKTHTAFTYMTYLY